MESHNHLIHKEKKKIIIIENNNNVNPNRWT